LKLTQQRRENGEPLSHGREYHRLPRTVMGGDPLSRRKRRTGVSRDRHAYRHRRTIAVRAAPRAHDPRCVETRSTICSGLSPYADLDARPTVMRTPPIYLRGQSCISSFHNWRARPWATECQCTVARPRHFDAPDPPAAGSGRCDSLRQEDRLPCCARCEAQRVPGRSADRQARQTSGRQTG
jgi:hypothetical protein